MNRKNTQKKAQEGQVLLLVIMLLASIVTVALTVVFKAQTDTQITKLQEDSQKSMSAAEAGIEAAVAKLKAGDVKTFADLNISGLDAIGIDTTASKVEVSSARRQTFISPLIQKDQQYTYYLADYDGTTFSNNYSGSLVMYYGSESGCSNIALEFTVVGGSPATVIQRNIADLGGIISNNGVGQVGSLANYPYPGTAFTFNCQATLNIPASQAELLFVRVIGAAGTTPSTRLATYSDFSAYPTQGKYIFSTAVTKTGVTKKVQLFQSYPQIPADFFVTQF